MEIKNKKISLRVKSYHLERLDYLQGILKCNRSEIIRLAITELFAREIYKNEGGNPIEKRSDNISQQRRR